MSVTQESPQNHIAGGSASASSSSASASISTYVSAASVAARIFISFDLHSHSITRPVPDPEMVGRTGVGYPIRLSDRDAGVTDESITNLAHTTTAISYKLNLNLNSFLLSIDIIIDHKILLQYAVD